LVECTCSRDWSEVNKSFEKWASGGEGFSKIIESECGDIDGIIIATFGISHYFYARWAIEEKKCHTLIDKPITSPAYCSTREEAATRIVDDYFNLICAAKDSNLKVVIGANRRYSDCFKKAKEEIKAVYKKREEAVNFVSCFTSDGWFAQKDEKGVSRGADPKISGGGKLMHTGYHWLDIIPWLLRESVVVDDVITVTVHSMFERYTFEDFKKSDDDYRDENVEKNAAIQVALRHVSGKTCLVDYSLLHEGFKNKEGGYGTQTDQEQFSVYQGPVAIWHRRFEYIGGRGRGTETLIQDGTANRVSTHRLLPAYDSDKTGPTMEFLKCLVQNRNPLTSPIEDHAIGVLLLASSYLSAIKGRTVEFQVKGLDSYLKDYKHQTTTEKSQSLDWLFRYV
jgi:predicted dehydrogenase